MGFRDFPECRTRGSGHLMGAVVYALPRKHGIRYEQPSDGIQIFGHGARHRRGIGSPACRRRLRRVGRAGIRS